MSLIINTLRVDDSNELPASMENWLNAGADWTSHHGIDLTPTTTSLVDDLLYSPPPPPPPPAPRPFLKLNTLELCKETTTTTTTVVRTDSSSSSIDSARDSSSPARTDSARKRSFGDLQGFGVPAVSGGVSAAAAAAGVAMGGTGAAAAGVLLPQLTLPTMASVPSMEEIAQSRPKRRNVRISTDPQSVAARHRRERISDRVRVLQHFVPGGTKMDTASMLDEAIHYVKFLQQQLQKLERLGNTYDARLMNGGVAAGMMMPQANNMHSFDLNYCTYPTTTTMLMQQQQSHHHQHQQAQNHNHNNNNNTTSSWSPRLQHCIPTDHQQFCH